MAPRLSAYGRAALGQESPTQVTSILPEARGPSSQISRTFLFQSYFDDTLAGTALLQQDQSNPIVASTAKVEQITGYGVGLHPSSQTPVAVQFSVGGQPSTGQPIYLKPGQVVRPYGLPGETSRAFSGFTWGLPFGWLGGGMATLVVLASPDAQVHWYQESPEIIFQRIRLRIVANGALPAVAPKNWPLRFPWSQAVRGADSGLQKGQAVLAVTPTRTIMRLRMTALGAPAVMRMITQDSNDFDLDSAGALIPGQASATDITWGTWAAFGAGNLATQYQMISLDDLGWRLAADDGGVVLASTGADLQGQYVDIARYGKLA